MLKNLATTLSRQGKLDQAIASYQQALAIEPDHSEINNNLGNCLMTQGKHAVARRHGFEVVSYHQETLRKEGTESILGEAYVLRSVS